MVAEMTQVAARTYAEELMSRGHGLPMWYPDCPQSDDGIEIQVGDVGFFSECVFIRLFNVTKSKEDPCNVGGVPEDFNKLEYNDRLKRYVKHYLDTRYICSKSTQGYDIEMGVTRGPGFDAGVQFSFKCSTTKGSMLVLKQHADKEAVTSNLDFLEYIRRHFASWYKFATETAHYNVKKADIIMVSGHVKTSEWGVAAAVSKRSKGFEIQFNGQGKDVAGGTFTLPKDEEPSSCVEYRTGPHRAPPSSASQVSDDATLQAQCLASETLNSEPFNQCIFLRYYKLKYRGFLGLRFKAAAGPAESPDPDQDGEGAGAVPAFEDPLDDVLDYILKTAPEDVDVAITSHGDVEELFNGRDWPENMANYLEQRKPRVDTRDGAAFLSISDAIYRAHAHPSAPQATGAAGAPLPGTGQDFGDVEMSDDIPLFSNQSPASGGNQEVSTSTTPSSDTREVDHSKWPHLVLLTDTTEGGTMYSAVLSQDGRLVAAGLEDDVVRIYNLQTNAEAPLHGLEGHEDSVSSTSSPHSKRLASGSMSFTPQWPHLILSDDVTQSGVACSVALSEDGRLVAAGFEDGVVRVWNLHTKSDAVLYRLEGHGDFVSAIAFSPDCKFLASGSADDKAIVWDMSSGTQVYELAGHEGDVWSIAYSPDGAKIATGSVDSFIKIWNARTGEELGMLRGHTSLVQYVCYSPDGSRLISCADAVGKIWDPINFIEIAELERCNGVIWSMAFSHDGGRIVTGAEDHVCRVCNTGKGEELVILREHTGPVWSVGFSPDDRRVISGAHDGTIVINDSYTGERYNVFRDECAIVNSVAYSPDAEFVVSGAADGSVKVWDTSNSELVCTFPGHTDKVKTVLFSSDNDRIVSYSDDGTVRVWSLTDVLRLRVKGTGPVIF